MDKQPFCASPSCSQQQDSSSVRLRFKYNHTDIPEGTPLWGREYSWWQLIFVFNLYSSVFGERLCITAGIFSTSNSFSRSWNYREASGDSEEQTLVPFNSPDATKLKKPLVFRANVSNWLTDCAACDITSRWMSAFNDFSTRERLATGVTRCHQAYADSRQLWGTSSRVQPSHVQQWNPPRGRDYMTDITDLRRTDRHWWWRVSGNVACNRWHHWKTLKKLDYTTPVT